MEVIYAESDNATYDALIELGVKETLFDRVDAVFNPGEDSIREIQGADGRVETVEGSCRRESRGCKTSVDVVFDTKRKGDGAAVEYECVYDWYDPSTGAHAPIEEILKACEIES